MDREYFMSIVYDELATDTDNLRANRIIEAFDEVYSNFEEALSIPHKVKAKSINSDSWFTGWYIQKDDTTFCFTEDYARHPNNTKHYIVFDRMTDWGLPNKTMITEIDPKTLKLIEGR